MIAIIIDHPNRELPFAVKITEKFLEKFSNIFLVPMYEIDDFFLSTEFKKTKIIIFNYIRKNNLKKIYHSHLSGKINIVYDTEGAPGLDGYDLTSFLKEVKNHLKILDLYLFWGQNQIDDIKKNLSFNINYEIVGFLRHLATKASNQNDTILINTNFSVITPLYSKSPKKDFQNASSLRNMEHIDFSERLREKINNRREVFEFISFISKEMPNEKFLIRPHPFEDKFDYQEIVKANHNVFFDQSLTSIEAITKSKALIHLDCTTSIEAYFLNKPIINLYWIHKESKYSYTPAKTNGYLAKNANDVKRTIEKLNINNNKDININYDEDKIRSFFGDKNNNLDDFVKFVSNTVDNYPQKKIQYSNLGMKSIIKFLLKKFTPNIFLEFVYSLYLGKKVYMNRKNKYFSLELIRGQSNANLKTEKVSNFYKVSKNV